MIRISLPYVYDLAVQLEPLGTLHAGKYGDVFLKLLTARQKIDELINSSVFAPTLRSSRNFADHLLTALDVFMDGKNLSDDLEYTDIFPVVSAFTQYKIALLTEFGVVPSYFVTQKGGFDTLSLLDHAHTLFSPDLMSKVPEAQFDVTEAGKALAYELGTACGFHVFRVTEAVLRRYYTQVTGGKAPPKVRNVGVYINAMRTAQCGDEKILSALKQMADLHRNPLVHPEVALTMDEAISIIGIARSVVTAMLSELPEQLPTTTMASSST